MADFLLELGTEEIPAFSLEAACQDLLDKMIAALDEEGLSVETSRTAATPRRMALCLLGLPDRQDDREEEVSGPPQKAAFDKDGNPTKAAIGFAKGQGATVDDIEIRETPKGPYCFLHKQIKGRSTAEVLAGILPGVIGSVHFPKSMRWALEGTTTFSRPIRSIAALLGSEVIPFAVNGVAAGRAVHGHPFLAPGPFDLEAPDFDTYLAALRDRCVIADVAERRKMVRTGVEEVLANHGSELTENELVDEVTNLVEFPCVVEGAFDESFLELPAEVIKTAMMDHQRYFPVEDGSGRLKARFITVINRDAGNADLIREGNERVLSARLADAAFFLREDRKKTLADRVEDLEGMVYQEKLGTYRSRVERLEKLARHLAGVLGLSAEETEDCGRAALLCKCDLTTEMVGEFPTLQGVVGREYALMDGESQAVATAVEEHYRPAFAGDRLPGTTVGKVIALAEKFDTVVGCFGAGLSPTGSQDPYGLRRQALGILRIVLEAGLELSLRETIRVAASSLPDNLPAPELLESRVLDFFWDRLYNMSVERGYRYDLVNAALATGYDDIHDFQKRIDAIKALSGEPGWEELVTVVQRTFNIYKNAGEVGAVSGDLLEAPEEKEIFRLFEEHATGIEKLLAAGDLAGASRKYAEVFVEPVHTFFDKVFVNVDDAAVKNNRLALMKTLNQLYTRHIADLSQVVME